MTAEIAILNKSAVALAADSAVTFNIGGEQQVFHTVNKLFSLSKYHPVGIMVYGNAEFMGVDWETIIKVYRRDLSTRVFDTLQEHAIDFMRFLRDNAELFDDRSQRQFVERRITYIFTAVLKDAMQQIDKHIKQHGKIAEPAMRATLNLSVTAWQDALRASPRLKDADGEDWPKDQITELSRRWRATIAKAKRAVFEDMPMDPALSRRLTTVAVLVLTREHFWEGYSGVVMAGYGKRQFFPVLFHNVIKLRRSGDGEDTISRDNNATIAPFAQSEMVHSFMQGVDPEYQEYIDETVNETLNTYGTELLDMLVPQSSPHRGVIQQQIAAATEAIARNTKNEMRRRRQARFISPVVEMVGALPKSELAAMAESLVNLTSFRRHVTPDAETVGGPIDVAVISRGDGFVWIKRKHYFPAELNHQFVENYYREGSDDDKEAAADQG